MRAGNVAAAPFVGDQFVSLYIGADRVLTVPSAPAITNVTSADGQVSCDYAPPESDGGSAITAYRFFVNGDFVGEATEGIPQPGDAADNADEETVPCEPGDIVRVSAVNAVGEGPKSDPFTAA
jgi:hypothetical protein